MLLKLEELPSWPQLTIQQKHSLSKNAQVSLENLTFGFANLQRNLLGLVDKKTTFTPHRSNNSDKFNWTNKKRQADYFDNLWIYWGWSDERLNKSSDEETMRTIHRPREACKRSYRKSLRANCLARATERKPVGGHLPYKLGFLITFLYHTTSASWPQARWNIPRRYRYPANKSAEDLLSRLWKIRRVISLCAKLLLLLLLLDAIAGKTWGKKKKIRDTLKQQWLKSS